MLLKSNLICCSLSAILLWSCSNQPQEQEEKEKTDSTNQVQAMGAEAACEEPNSLITQAKAKEMVELYSQKLNSQKDLTQYVSKDIEELEKMLTYFKCHGKTHVKFYFGMSPYDNGEKTVERLTIFMEGAKECSSPEPGDVNCLEDGDPADEIKPFDLNHPCPPPKCSGRSRYY